MRTKPNLLYISPLSPDPDGYGSSKRAYSILQALASKYSVYLLVIPVRLRNPSLGRSALNLCAQAACISINPLRDFKVILTRIFQKIFPKLIYQRISQPSEYLSITHSRIKSASQVYSGVQFDLIHIFRLYMVPYAFPYLQNVFSGISQLDMDDIESLTRKRFSELYRINGNHLKALLMLREYEKYRDIEKSVVPLFDRVFVCSEKDKERLLQSLACKEVIVIPNVVQISSIKEDKKRNLPFTFLFVGSMEYFPNFDGIRYLCFEILPLLRAKVKWNFTVKIVGGGLSRKLASRLSKIQEVEVTGHTNDLEKLYTNADAVLVPLRAGGGTRIKALEAFAYRKPVVSTSLGVEGIRVRSEEHLLIGDAPAEFASQCLRLIENPRLGKRLVDNAFSLVQELYSPEGLKEKISQL